MTDSTQVPIPYDPRSTNRWLRAIFVVALIGLIITICQAYIGNQKETQTERRIRKLEDDVAVLRRSKLAQDDLNDKLIDGFDRVLKELKHATNAK